MERVQLRALLAVALATVVVLDADAYIAEEQFIPAVPGAPSSEGEMFVVAFMRNNIPRTAGSPEPQVFFMVTTLDIEPVEFDVMTAFDGVEESTMYTVTRDQPARVNFSADSVYVLDDNDNDKAIWVQTRNGKRVSVYVINDEEASSDGFVALPCDGMGAGGVFRRYDYLILSGAQVLPQGQQQQPRNSLILLITCEDNTRVTVTPSQAISGGNDFAQNTVGPGGEAAEDDWIIVGPGGISNNIPAKTTLLILNTFDLTGSRVRSNKPLVVISGHECAHVPEDRTACDFIGAQIPPHTTWGHKFVLNPLASRFSGDYYRFATLQDNTEVTIACVDAGATDVTSATTTTINLNAAVGQNWDQFETHLPLPPPCHDPFIPKFCLLKSTNPVMVAQYSYGHSVDGSCQPEGISGDLGDPFMSVIPPVVQYLNCYSIPPVILRQRVSFRHLGVIVNARYFNPSRILLDGMPLQSDQSLWQPVFDPPDVEIWDYAITVDLDDNAHIVCHMDENAAISVHSYGFSNENSYGLSGGMELQQISGTTISCTIPIPPDCVPEGVTVTVTCDRGLDLTVQTRIEISSEDGTATAGEDYNMINFPGIGANRLANNVINYRGGINMDASRSFTFSTIADSDDTEPPETFFINVIAMRTASILTPRIEVTICGVVTEIDCPELDNPANGMVSVSDRTPGSVANYTCNAGFTVVGAPLLTCLPNGMWDNAPPTCELDTVTVSFNPTSYTVTEGLNPTADLMLVRSGGLGRSVTLTVTTTAGSAADGSDFNSISMQITFGPEQLSAAVQVPIVNDTIIENTEMFTATLSTAEINVMIIDDTATVTIIDNDDCPPLDDPPNGSVTVTGDTAVYACLPGFILVGDPIRMCLSNSMWTGTEPMCIGIPPRPQFEQTMYTVPENDRTVPLCIDIGVDVPEPMNFTITAIQKAPPEADDADFNHWTIIWIHDGSGACTDFTDLVVDDDIALEGDQNFTILVDGSMAMVTIIDDDFPIIESDNIVINEDAGSATVTVRLLNQIENNFVLSYRTAEFDSGANDEEDFESQAGMITFMPGGATSLSVEIPITDDRDLESDEPLMIIFSSTDLPPGMQDVLTPNITIIDNDIIVGFNPILYTVMEGMAMPFVRLSLFRQGNVDLTANVSIITVPGTAVAVGDYTPITMNVVFASGQTTATLDVPITNDMVLEEDEMFSATLMSQEPNVMVQDANSNADITIFDDDRVTIGFLETSYTANEGDDEVLVRVGILSGELSEDVTVTLMTQDGSANEPSDYLAASVPLVFGPGSTSIDFAISISGDTVYEPGIEQFLANLELVTTGVDVTVRPEQATIQIFDDDNPNPQFVDPMYVVPENNRSNVPLCIDLGVMITSTVVYDIFTSQKSPPEAEFSDFTAGTAIAVEPPGPVGCTDFLALVVDDDLALEGNEAFNIMIGGTGSTTMVTILDDDVVSVGFDPTRYNVLEGDSTDLVIRRMGDAEGSVVVSVSTSDITAIAGADYEPLDAVQVVFQPGVFTQTLTLNTITELASEGDEQLRATLTAATSGVGITADTATVTITEDVEPTLSFSTVDEVVEEDGARAEVCLMLNIPLATPLDVSITSATGSASVDDFVVETLTASFAAGDTEACVVFTVIDDTIALEPDETFTATFQPPDGIRTEGPLTATVTIIDDVVDDDVFTIQFSEDDYSFEEGEMGAEVCLDGVGTIAQPATAIISSLPGGSATVGEDYTAISSVEVTFQPGDTMICVELDLPQDEILEDEESFRIVIEAVGPLPGVVIGDRNETTVFIRDDDVARIGFDPVLYDTNEGFGFMTVTVRLLDGSLSDDVVVTLATEDDSAIDGEDYLGVVQDLVFGPGIDRVDVNISIIDDNTYEPDSETFRALLRLVTPGAAVNIDPAVATISITDDDRPVPQFVDRMYVVPENERSNVPLCIDIGVTITSPITYTITTEQKSPPEAEDSDFGTTASITVNPPGAEGCTNFEALVVDDNVALEGDEAFTIRVDVSMAMVTILDDDVPELTTRDVTVSEGVGEALVCVQLANTVEAPFGVRFDTSDGTAQAPDDYFLRSAAFGFIPDESCEGIGINDDDLQEPTENFFVTFVPEVPGARSVVATINIRDNDEPIIVGDIVNDTIIGDPLFTATLPDGDEFMCYEVHSQAGKYFNLISDACLSVNAFFSALPEEPRINRISEIGIYARDSADTCVPIEVDLEGCTGSIGGQPFFVGASGRVRYERNSISVRSYPARWRVSVPNCGSTPVVMWILCGSDPAMMRIHIARGNGLAQSSHGLLAQFWNIPVTVLREGDQVTLRLFDDPLDPRYRLIPAEPAPRTWDHTHATCYYVGNAQGGPADFHDAIESVIQGNLLQYETSSLFSPEFDFNQFDDSFCITPA